MKITHHKNITALIAILVLTQCIGEIRAQTTEYHLANFSNGGAPLAGTGDGQAYITNMTQVSTSPNRWTYNANYTGDWTISGGNGSVNVGVDYWMVWDDAGTPSFGSEALSGPGGSRPMLFQGYSQQTGSGGLGDNGYPILSNPEIAGDFNIPWIGGQAPTRGFQGGGTFTFEFAQAPNAEYTFYIIDLDGRTQLNVKSYDVNGLLLSTAGWNSITVDATAPYDTSPDIWDGAAGTLTGSQDVGPSQDVEVNLTSLRPDNYSQVRKIELSWMYDNLDGEPLGPSDMMSFWGEGLYFGFSSPLILSPIPEPSTYALLALGVMGSGIVAVRRRRQMNNENVELQNQAAPGKA